MWLCSWLHNLWPSCNLLVCLVFYIPHGRCIAKIIVQLCSGDPAIFTWLITFVSNTTCQTTLDRLVLVGFPSFWNMIELSIFVVMFIFQICEPLFDLDFFFESTNIKFFLIKVYHTARFDWTWTPVWLFQGVEQKAHLRSWNCHLLVTVVVWVLLLLI